VFERSQPASQLARFGGDGAEPQVPAFARFGVIRVKGSCRSSDRDDFERSQSASQLARFGVNDARGSCRSSDRDDFERSQPASQLARFGVNPTRGSCRSSDRKNNACPLSLALA
jgi:hypothetical protein